MEATEGGAFDYIAKPFDLTRLLGVVGRAAAAIEERSKKQADRSENVDDPPAGEMVGSSAAMVEVYKLISRAAPTDAAVMIEGESGTGKELVARLIHRNSPRSQGPFVPVDCGSIAAGHHGKRAFRQLARRPSPAPTATAWA